MSALLLPPLGLVWLGLLAGLLAWRGLRAAGLLAALASAGVLALGTPMAAGWLSASVELPQTADVGSPPGAIVILGGNVAHGPHHVTEIGLLTLERLRVGAALHRATGLPILVTGGVLGAGQPPLATLMARSLQEDFGVATRWVEPRARDTRENAIFSAAMLRRDGVAAALLVTQSWHLARASAAFARVGFAVRAAPVRRSTGPSLEWQSLVPQVEALEESWFAIHEWVGRAWYLWRDGAASDPPTRNFTRDDPFGAQGFAAIHAMGEVRRPGTHMPQRVATEDQALMKLAEFAEDMSRSAKVDVAGVATPPNSPAIIGEPEAVQLSILSQGRMPDWCDAYLAASGEGDIFASRLWYDTVLAHLPLRHGRPLLACAAGMLLPLLDRSGARRSLTCDYTIGWRPLVARDCTADWTAEQAGKAFGRWLRLSPPLRLDALQHDAPGLRPMLSGLESAGLHTLLHAHFGNWHERLVAGAGWAGYLDTRPTALVSTIRRKTERARRDLRFEMVSHGQAAVRRAVTDYEQVRAGSWKPDEPWPAFDGALIRAAAAQGCLRMGLLRTAEGKPVAAQYWLLSGGRAWLLKLCHDEANRNASPGTVLTAMMIQRLIEDDGARELDFGRGDDPYKQLWVSQRRLRVGLVLADPWHPAGLLQVARRRVAQWAGRAGVRPGIETA